MKHEEIKMFTHDDMNMQKGKQSVWPFNDLKSLKNPQRNGRIVGLGNEMLGFAHSTAS